VTATPDSANIAGALSRMARELPDGAAIHLPTGRGPASTRTYKTLTYAELDALSTRVASGLSAAGIEKGMRAALMVPPSPELFGLVFGLYKAGVVPVMIDPGIGLAKMGACLDQARPDAFIGIPLAQAVRTVKGWGKATIRHNLTVGRRWFWGGDKLDKVLAAGSDDDPEVARTLDATDGDDIAAILFTSGATGPPKGVVYRHRHFAGQVRMIGDMYGIEPGEVDLPTFPLFALFDPALGMTTVLPRMDFTKPAKVEPGEIFGAVTRFGCTNMFGSPALLDIVSRSLEGKFKMPTIRRVITAGAPVSPKILQRMAGLLGPDARIHTPYGATENLPVASIDHREVLADTAARTATGAGVCVGRPLADNDVRIIAIRDEPIPTWTDDLALPAGEIGEITNLGPTTTDTYFGPDDAPHPANAAAKIHHDDGRVRHRMGDVGYLDAQGRLWYCGRKAHRVRTASGTKFTIPAEGVFNNHEGIRRSALVGVPAGDHDVEVVILQAEPGAAAKGQAAMAGIRALAADHEVTAPIAHFLWHDGLPVDIRHNAKIDRPALAKWAATRVDPGADR